MTSFDFSPVRAELGLPTDYPPDAVADAAAATDSRSERRDATDIAFVTIDPPGSMDLDQAVCLTRTDSGFVVHYAIADVGAVVRPGGPLDRETHARGQTVYLPDGSVPLHPTVLSEGTSSLLPDAVRPVALWTIALSLDGTATAWTVEAAAVRSRRRFTYAEVQDAHDRGELHPSLEALPDVGRLRRALALRRGAIELALPEQDVVPDGDRWRVQIAPRTDADWWNAEISLLTGMCAAQIMIDAGVGILRTLPPAGAADLDALRAAAAALSVPWPDAMSAGEMLAGLDPTEPATLALMTQATRLLRGASYVPFTGGELPEQPDHSGIGGPYAHVTAPLRRLVDRYAAEVCLASCAGDEVPRWVVDALTELPKDMRRSDQRSDAAERAGVDLTEATVLAPRVGETFDAVVLRAATDTRPAQIFVADASVLADCEGDPAVGTTVTVRLITADVTTRTVLFGAVVP